MFMVLNHNYPNIGKEVAASSSGSGYIKRRQYSRGDTFRLTEKGMLYLKMVEGMQNLEIKV
jgi:predicted transcriptional regulator